MQEKAARLPGGLAFALECGGCYKDQQGRNYWRIVAVMEYLTSSFVSRDDFMHARFNVLHQCSLDELNEIYPQVFNDDGTLSEDQPEIWLWRWKTVRPFTSPHCYIRSGSESTWAYFKLNDAVDMVTLGMTPSPNNVVSMALIDAAAFYNMGNMGGAHPAGPEAAIAPLQEVRSLEAAFHAEAAEADSAESHDRRDNGQGGQGGQDPAEPEPRSPQPAWQEGGGQGNQQDPQPQDEPEHLAEADLLVGAALSTLSSPIRQRRESHQTAPPPPSPAEPQDEAVGESVRMSARELEREMAREALAMTRRRQALDGNPKSPNPYQELPPTRVHSLRGMFNWADDFFKMLAETFPTKVLHHLRDKQESFTRSSCFSGVDGAGMADRIIASDLQDRLRMPCKPMKFESAVENDIKCQQELVGTPGEDSPHHIFCDIEDFWQNGVRLTIQRYKNRGISPDLRSFEKLAKSRTGVKRTAYCVMHDKHCEHPRSTYHQASPPCTAFSRIGKCDDTRGDSMTAVAAWFSQRLLLEVTGMEFQWQKQRLPRGQGAEGPRGARQNYQATSRPPGCCLLSQGPDKRPFLPGFPSSPSRDSGDSGDSDFRASRPPGCER